ncbi:MAG: transpeptidase family protein [Deltaproteobacteria bacterium]|nr:transpeptidase family protein [Deltaproteobacteria bacterium]
MPSEQLDNLADRQFQRTLQKSALRKSISDRNGEELAVSAPSSSLFVRPHFVVNKAKTARLLSKILGGPASKWLHRLNSPKPFVWISRQIGEELTGRIAAKKMGGIFVEPENKRLYPNGELAANLIGFTDPDGNGLEGLELVLNDRLIEQPERTHFWRDGKGNPSYIAEKLRKVTSSDLPKKAIRLTVDRRIQHLVEEELTQTLQVTNAKAALAIVMQPQTGEILALGQRPSFDPNRITQHQRQYFTNRLVSHLYEPGSTLKVFLAAEAIENGLMTKNSPVDCGQGKIKIGNKLIHEAETSHQYGTLPLRHVIAYSSNIGAIRIAETLGVDRVRHMFDQFGLTSKTGVRLPGEVYSAPKPQPFWRPIALATAAFGQGIAVTPLQLVTAFGVIANGGYWVHPKILMEEMELTSTNNPDRKRILSPETALVMREMLTGVTEEKRGTGSLAKIAGVKVAGKTGTAQKYEAGSGYEGGKYFSSFVGFLPADKPELLVGVFIDEPAHNYYASQVAAPLFAKIAERALQILDRIPKTAVAQAGEAMPHPPQKTTQPILAEAGDGKWTMPDLTGFSMREALQGIGPHLDKIRVAGNGFVQAQSPKPGITVTNDTPITLYFNE